MNNGTAGGWNQNKRSEEREIRDFRGRDTAVRKEGYFYLFIRKTGEEDEGWRNSGKMTEAASLEQKMDTKILTKKVRRRLTRGIFCQFRDDVTYSLPFLVCLYTFTFNTPDRLLFSFYPKMKALELSHIWAIFRETYSIWASKAHFPSKCCRHEHHEISGCFFRKHTILSSPVQHTDDH